MSGDQEKILSLWEIKLGKRPPDNLDGEFRVQLGIYTEPFNAEWFTLKTGYPIIARNDFRKAKKPLPIWMQANLDGEVLCPNGKSAVFEAKHTGGHVSMKEALALYQPQIHHNMLVAGLDKAFLSVILGNEWDYVEIDFNREYADALLKAEAEFWECVRLGMPPSEVPPIVDPPEATRVIDMGGSEEWGALAADWIANRDKAKAFEVAADRIKKLVPADARVAAGHGIRVTRDKRRYLKITKDGGDNE